VLLQPPLRRTPSLGQQAADALPPDLQEMALQMLNQTDLQDEALEHMRSSGMPHVQRGASLISATADDMESFLWDFLETSQENASQGGAA